MRRIALVLCISVCALVGMGPSATAEPPGYPYPNGCSDPSTFIHNGYDGGGYFGLCTPVGFVGGGGSGGRGYMTVDGASSSPAPFKGYVVLHWSFAPGLPVPVPEGAYVGCSFADADWHGEREGECQPPPVGSGGAG